MFRTCGPDSYTISLNCSRSPDFRSYVCSEIIPACRLQPILSQSLDPYSRSAVWRSGKVLGGPISFRRWTMARPAASRSGYGVFDGCVFLLFDIVQRSVQRRSATCAGGSGVFSIVPSSGISVSVMFGTVVFGECAAVACVIGTVFVFIRMVVSNPISFPKIKGRATDFGMMILYYI